MYWPQITYLFCGQYFLAEFTYFVHSCLGLPLPRTYPPNTHKNHDMTHKKIQGVHPLGALKWTFNWPISKDKVRCQHICCGRIITIVVHQKSQMTPQIRVRVTWPTDMKTSSNPACKTSKYTFSVADPGFLVGGRGPRRGGCGLPRWLHFANFVCQNERIWTLWGRARRTPHKSANAFNTCQNCLDSISPWPH